MKNLATGNPTLEQADAIDSQIIDELTAAGINYKIVERRKGEEVPSRIVGYLGDWTFGRAWYYWCAGADGGKGLPLSVAIKLNNKIYPELEPPTNQGRGTSRPTIYGDVVRVAGMAGGDDPRKWAKSYDSDGKELVVDSFERAKKIARELYGTGEKAEKFLTDIKNKYHCVNSKEEMDKLGIRVIDGYHIDTQEGLNEFARTIVENPMPVRKVA